MSKVKAESVRVVFVNAENGPERLACHAELLFESGPLAGMKLCGFSLWRSPEGEVYLTFPSRAFGVGTERRFFDFLRTQDASAGNISKGIKAWILEAYKREREPEQYASEHAPAFDGSASGKSRAYTA